jgi:hypothetical protein
MAMYKALILGTGYPPEGVPDTPENRATWDEMAAEMEAAPPGTIWEIPWDWADMPDDE